MNKRRRLQPLSCPRDAPARWRQVAGSVQCSEVLEKLAFVRTNKWKSAALSCPRNQKTGRYNGFMNIYLDIDGVLVHNGKPADHLEAFIEYLHSNYAGNIYWLTTHCQGDSAPAVTYIERFVTNAETLKRIREFKPTKWGVSKTEGIDFGASFLWFDDTLLYGEKQILAGRGASDNMILVNLTKNPDSLRRFIYDFPIPV